MARPRKSASPAQPELHTLELETNELRLVAELLTSATIRGTMGIRVANSLLDKVEAILPAPPPQGQPQG